MCDTLTAQSLCLLTAAPSDGISGRVRTSSPPSSVHQSSLHLIFFGEKKNSLANKRPGELALLSLHSIPPVSPFSTLIYLSSMHVQ